MSNPRKLDNVTLADIRDVLSQNGKKSNGNWLFQCPICLDSSCDNLIVKDNGTYIHCFSCANNEGGRYVLTEIEKKRAKEREKEKKQDILNEKPRFLDKKLQEEYLTYMSSSNKKLLENDDMLDFLYKQRGIDRQTVIDCEIGYDDTKENWVIPIFSLKYDGMLMGFEYRSKNFDKYSNGSKVRREKGYIVDICPVWGRKKAKTLILCEGFWDGYALHQYLRNKGDDNHTIYSCSNGVTSFVKVMNRITFANFGEVKLILDTDEAGSKITNEIIDKFSFIKDKRAFLFKGGYKDVNQWLMEKVQKSEVK